MKLLSTVAALVLGA